MDGAPNTDWLTDKTDILLDVQCVTIYHRENNWGNGHAVAENLLRWVWGRAGWWAGRLPVWLIDHQSRFSHVETHTACQACDSRALSCVLRWSDIKHDQPQSIHLETGLHTKHRFCNIIDPWGNLQLGFVSWFLFKNQCNLSDGGLCPPKPQTLNF